MFAMETEAAYGPKSAKRLEMALLNDHAGADVSMRASTSAAAPPPFALAFA